MFKVVL